MKILKMQIVILQFLSLPMFLINVAHSQCALDVAHSRCTINVVFVNDVTDYRGSSDFIYGFH